VPRSMCHCATLHHPSHAKLSRWVLLEEKEQKKGPFPSPELLARGTGGGGWLAGVPGTRGAAGTAHQWVSWWGPTGTRGEGGGAYQEAEEEGGLGGAYQEPGEGIRVGVAYQEPGVLQALRSRGSPGGVPLAEDGDEVHALRARVRDHLAQRQRGYCGTTGTQRVHHSSQYKAAGGKQHSSGEEATASAAVLPRTTTARTSPVLE